MATKKLSNEFMQNIATDEAWKELSSSFNWSEALLEKHRRAESQAAGRGNYGISDSLRVRYRVICLIPLTPKRIKRANGIVLRQLL